MRVLTLIFVFLIVIYSVQSDSPDKKFVDTNEVELVDDSNTVKEEPRFEQKEKSKVKEDDPWWLKDVPWFLPPPPEWGPLPPTMYMSYYHKPYSAPLSTPNYYPLYSKDSEFLPLAPSYPSNYPWTPGSFKDSSAPLTAVGPSIRVSPYLAYMHGGRTPSPDSVPPSFIEKSSITTKTKSSKSSHSNSHLNKAKKMKNEKKRTKTLRIK